MGERTLVGVIDPDNRTYHAVYYQTGLDITALLPELRRVWCDTHHGDSTAMAEAMVDPRHVGYELWHGTIDEVPDSDLVQLTLLHPDHAGVSVYVPDHQGAWLLLSRHLLADTGQDLFTMAVVEERGTWTCTQCGAADRYMFHGAPATVAGGPRTVLTCRGCESTETTEPDFTVTVHRVTTDTTPTA